MINEEEDFVLRPKNVRSLRRDRQPQLRVFRKNAVLATRVFTARAIAKVTHAKFSNLKAGTAAAHVRYLDRESAQSHDLRAEKVFGTCGKETFLRPLSGEKRIFKIVLSPQEYFTLDPKLYVHAFVGELQRRAGVWESGQRADWCAIVHTNTENPHIHVLIHGITKDGQDLYFQRRVIEDASGLATRIQDRMTGWLPLTEELLQERRAARRYDPMPKYSNSSLDEILQKNSGRSDWSGILDRVPYYRRRALHQRMVFAENHDLIRQDERGMVLVAPNFSDQLATLARGLRLVEEKAQLRCLSRPPFEFAHARTPTCFGLLTETFELGLSKSRYVVLETTKNTAVAVRVTDDQVAVFNELARSRSLVRLKNGVPERFRGDPGRLIRVGLHSSGPVAKEVVSKVGEKPPQLVRDSRGIGR